MIVGIGIGIPEQHHLAAEAADRVYLHLRRGHRHHDHRLAAQTMGRQGHALRMVAGRGTDDATLELRWREVRHLVVGAAQLEAVHGLLVFALEQHGVVQAFA